MSRATFSMTEAGSTPTTELAPAAAGAPDGDAGSAPDVDDVVAVTDAGQLHGELGVRVAAEVEGQRGDEATDTAESSVVGVVVGWNCRLGRGECHVEHLDT